MKNPFKIIFDWFGQPVETKQRGKTNSFFKTKPDLMVDTSVAFYQSAASKLANLKSKIEIPDYNSLEFEEEIEDFTLTSLSSEAKVRIIQIIKNDEWDRMSTKYNTHHKVLKPNCDFGMEHLQDLTNKHRNPKK